jgi:hypothetical protein
MRILAIVFLLQLSGYNAYPQWTQSSGLTGGAVWDIAIQDTILYIYVGGGESIFRRSVSQSTWEKVFTYYYCSEIEVTDSAVIVTDMIETLFRSFDHGDTWEEFSAPNGENLWSMAALDHSLFISTEMSNVYRTNDHGESWDIIMSDISFSGTPKIWADNGFVYVATGHYADTIIYESADNGNSWNEIPFQGLPLGDDGLNTVIRNQDHIWVSDPYGVFVFTSSEWLLENTGLPVGVQIKELLDINGTLYTVTRSGYFYYNGAEWVGFNEGLPFNFPVGLVKYDDKFYGADASGPHWRYQNEDWQDDFEGLNFVEVNDLDHSGDTICACTKKGFYLSYDFGESFTRIPLDSILSCQQVIVTDSLYYLLNKEHGLGVSYDKGLHWEMKSSGLPEYSYLYSFGMNDEKIYLGCNSGLYACSHGSYVWEFVFDSIGYGSYGDLIVFDSIIMFSGNAVYLSQNNGEDFIKVNDSVYALRFLDERYFALESEFLYGDNFLHHSLDALTWQKFLIEEKIRSYDVVGSTILLGGAKLFPVSNYLSISYDFGGSWISILDDLPVNIDHSAIRYADIIDHRIFTSPIDRSLWYRDDLLTGIPDDYPPNKELLLYPNPTGDKLTVQLPDDNGRDIQIRIFDVFGRSHKVSAASISDNSVRISTAQLPPSIYLINIIADNQMYSAKFIKE